MIPVGFDTSHSQGFHGKEEDPLWELQGLSPNAPLSELAWLDLGGIR